MILHGARPTQSMYERVMPSTACTVQHTLHRGLLASLLLLLLVTGQHAAVTGTTPASSLAAWLLLAATVALAAMQHTLHLATRTVQPASDQAPPEAASPPDRYAVLCFPMPDPAWTLASAVPAPPAYALSLRDLRARPVASAIRRPSPLMGRLPARAFASPMPGAGGARGPAPTAASPTDEPRSTAGQLRIDARMFARMSSQQILQGAWYGCVACRWCLTGVFLITTPNHDAMTHSTQGSRGG